VIIDYPTPYSVKSSQTQGESDAQLRLLRVITVDFVGALLGLATAAIHSCVFARHPTLTPPATSGKPADIAHQQPDLALDEPGLLAHLPS
jgi:hypothetical protein